MAPPEDGFAEEAALGLDVRSRDLEKTQAGDVRPYALKWGDVTLIDEDRPV